MKSALKICHAAARAPAIRVLSGALPDSAATPANLTAALQSFAPTARRQRFAAADAPSALLLHPLPCCPSSSPRASPPKNRQGAGRAALRRRCCQSQEAPAAASPTEPMEGSARCRRAQRRLLSAAWNASTKESMAQAAAHSKHMENLFTSGRLLCVGSSMQDSAVVTANGKAPKPRFAIALPPAGEYSADEALEQYNRLHGASARLLHGEPVQVDQSGSNLFSCRGREAAQGGGGRGDRDALEKSSPETCRRPLACAAERRAGDREEIGWRKCVLCVGGACGARACGGGACGVQRSRRWQEGGGREGRQHMAALVLRSLFLPRVPV